MERYYTNKIEEVRIALKKRNEDKVLIKEVANFFKSEAKCNAPKLLIGGNKAILGRQLLSAKVETVFAKAVSNVLGIELVNPTFIKDRFVRVSKEKLSYVKPHFLGEETSFDLLSGSEIDYYEKKKAKLSDIVLANNQSLVDYHLNLVSNSLWPMR